MKVLLTGSNGLLGQKLIPLLLQQGVELIATSRGENRSEEQNGYTYFPIDLAIPGALAQCIQNEKPDAIIHTAALTNVDACESEQDLCLRLNVDVVEEIVAAIQGTACHFVHLSTYFVFDGQQGPYSETDALNPLSVYGKSKAESERIVSESQLQKWTIARTIIVYGLCAQMSRSNLVLWAKGAMEKGEKLRIVNDQFRSPTLAEDLAQGCWAIVREGATGIFHLGGPETKSIYELVLEVAEVFGGDKDLLISTSSADLGQPANRPPRTGLDISKAKKVLGYAPRTFLEGVKFVKTQWEANN